jgi:trehalose 6-phosphate phosphatase
VSLGDLAGLRLGRHALFLDFDGTLAEIGPDPAAIRLPEETETALHRLALRLDGAVAVLSGRDLRDLAGRTPSAVWRAGGHGLETLAPGDPPPPAPPTLAEAVLAPLRAAAAAPGLRLELKGPVAALHFRAVPEAAGDAIAAAEAAARAAPGLVHQVGKMVVEVKPAGAHKGRALRRLAARAPFAGRVPLMLGDDATDEDAMAAALALGGIAVKIGPGPTAARLRAPDAAAVRAWLAREAGQPERPWRYTV